MSVLNPAGVWILLFILLFAVLIRLSLRFRRRPTPAFFLLADVVDALPLLSNSFLRRRRLRLFLLLAAVVCICLSALLPVIGHRVDPVNTVVVIDHRARRLDEAGHDRGRQAVIEAASVTLKELNGRDRVLVVFSDRGPITDGFVPVRTALRSLKSEPPSDLPAAEGTIRILLSGLGSLKPDLGYVVSPYPEEWHEAAASSEFPWRIVPASSLSVDRNAAILDVDIRPDLLHRSRYSIFCRLAAFTRNPGEAIPAHLSVLLDGAAVLEKEFLLEPGEDTVFVAENLFLRGGLLSLRLSPDDGFMQDNIFRTPVRERPFHRVDLYTSGNGALEAALGALGTISLRVLTPEEKDPPAPAAVTVYDGHVPEVVRGSSLFVGPFSMPPGISQRGESSYPSRISRVRHDPLLEGVTFAGLRLGRMPVLVPSPAMNVLARADGSPLVVAGRMPSGHRMALLAFSPVETGWIFDPEFPILIANLLSWLSLDSRSAGASFAVGDTADRELFSSEGLLTGPDGNSTDLSRSLAGSYTFPRAGVYTIGSQGREGSVFVNLLNEHVSMSAVGGAGDGEFPMPPLPERPYSKPIQIPLLLLGLLFLLLEPLVAPRARAGRLP